MSLLILLAIALIPVVAAVMGTNFIWKLLAIGLALASFVAFGMVGLWSATLLWLLALVFAGLALAGRSRSAFDAIDHREIERNIERSRSEPRF